MWVTVGPLCNPAALWSQHGQMRKCLWIKWLAQSPLHVFLTACPLAQRGTQTVLPNPAYVTLSQWHAPHAGICLSILGTSERWQAVGGPAVCVGKSFGKEISWSFGHLKCSLEQEKRPRMCVFTATSLVAVLPGRPWQCQWPRSRSAIKFTALSKCSHAITVAISSAALCSCNGPSALSWGYAACQH